MALLGFVGDVLVDREDPPSVFIDVAGVLGAPDVLFANCEGPYGTDPEPTPTAGVPLTPHPRNTEALGVFDVMSMANNHMVDLGHRTMLKTAELLRKRGVQPVGAGRDLAEARTPAVVETNGRKIAYLAYASVFPNGYEARPDWPGIAPLRAYNHHIDRLPNYWEPGIPGKVISVPHEEDHTNMREDLEAASSCSDVVVATFHWGDFQPPPHRPRHRVVPGQADLLWARPLRLRHRRHPAARLVPGQLRRSGRGRQLCALSPRRLADHAHAPRRPDDDARLG